MKLQNKIVIITGSSSGIGAATAVRFANEGAKVVINYLSNQEGAEKVLKLILDAGGAALIVQADVSQEHEAKKLIEETISHFGGLDVLINNAGKYYEGDEWNESSKAWDDTVQTNLYSVLNCTKYAGEYFLKKHNKGVIVNIASKYGITGQFDAIAYGAAKAGVINITKAYAKTLAPHIRANSISLGAVKTGYWLTEDAQNYIEEERKSVLLGDLVEVEDVVNAILFLSCDDSKMITGHNLVVDGGFTLK